MSTPSRPSTVSPPISSCAKRPTAKLIFRTSPSPNTRLFVLTSQLVVAPPTPSSRVSRCGSRTRPSRSTAVSVTIERSAPVSSSSRAGLPLIRTGTNIRLARVSIGNTAWRSSGQDCPKSPAPVGPVAHPARPMTSSRLRTSIACRRICHFGRPYRLVMWPAWAWVDKPLSRVSCGSSADLGFRADIPHWPAAGAGGGGGAARTILFRTRTVQKITNATIRNWITALMNNPKFSVAAPAVFAASIVG